MGQRDLVALNRGYLRHPLFGNRDFWFEQSVEPGWWDRAMEEGQDDVRRELIEALDRVARRLTTNR